MEPGLLGKEYDDGAVICRQGDKGEHMYVMQSGRAVVIHEDGGMEAEVGELAAGDVFGEMAIFDREPRSATVRVKGSARVLTLDKRAFLRQVHEDPSFAFRLLQKMSQRTRGLVQEVARFKRASTGQSAPSRERQD